MTFNCTICGKQHNSSEISFATAAPEQWWMISDEERANSSLGEDQCQIHSKEGPSYYVRACLEIPIRGDSGSLHWGVWCSLSASSCGKMMLRWDDPARTDFGPYFGWLCTVIPFYPDTMFLKSDVHEREVGQRPLVILQASDHPLAIDQVQGIEQSRYQEIVESLLHDGG